MTRLAAAVCVLVFLSGVSARTPAAVYNEANDLYRQGAYEQALELYGSIGVANPDLEHNRAMTWLRLGDIGRAMIHFNRAARLRPGDEETRAAIEYIRSIRRDRAPEAEGAAIVSAAARLLSAPSLSAVEWAAAGLSLPASLRVNPILS